MSTPPSSNTTTPPVVSNATTDTLSADAVPPERKVVRYVKIQPGHRITVTICMMLILNTVLSGAFALFASTVEVTGPQRVDDASDIYDIIGLFLFLLWNSFLWILIILVPSMTTDKRERYLPLFYLSGCSTFFIRLSDFIRPLTTFHKISSVVINFFSYLLYMAVFVVFYALPDELHVLSRSASMKPWKPVYEGDEDEQQPQSQEGTNNTLPSMSTNV